MFSEVLNQIFTFGVKLKREFCLSEWKQLVFVMEEEKNATHCNELQQNMRILLAYRGLTAEKIRESQKRDQLVEFCS